MLPGSQGAAGEDNGKVPDLVAMTTTRDVFDAEDLGELPPHDLVLFDEASQGQPAACPRVGAARPP